MNTCTHMRELTLMGIVLVIPREGCSVVYSIVFVKPSSDCVKRHELMIETTTARVWPCWVTWWGWSVDGQ